MIRKNITLCILLLLSTTFVVAKADSTGEFDISDYAGKVVIVDFWASWCVPCRRSFPWMNELQERHGKDGLVIIAFNEDAERAAAESFLADYPAAFEVHYDQDGVVARQFGLIAMPSSFVFNRDGELVAKHLGFKEKRIDEYEAVIVSALEMANIESAAQIK